MPTFTGKTFASFYKNILGINQSSNTGVDTATRKVHDGDGNNTAISLSDDEFIVQPVNDDTVRTFTTKTQGGSNILAVDATNSKVLVNAGQVAANTQYATFGINYANFSNMAANTQHPIPYIAGGITTTNDVDFGTGLYPATTFTTADTDKQYASQLVPLLWYIPDDITISSVSHLEGADNATGEASVLNLNSYTFTSGSTSCLSVPTQLAHGGLTNAGNEQVYLDSWTIDSSDVDAVKVILAFVRLAISVNSDYSYQVIVKYFIR